MTSAFDFNRIFSFTTLPFYSSLLFYTNHVAAFLKGKTEYAYSFYLLTFTSLIVHGIYDFAQQQI